MPIQMDLQADVAQSSTCHHVAIGHTQFLMLLLLLQLQHLELQDLLPTLRLLGRLSHLGRTALPQTLQLLLTATLLLFVHLGTGAR